MDTDAVILAGGYSSRANAFKMELKLEEKSILQYMIEAFLPICNTVIVVGGYQVERLYPLVQYYNEKVRIVNNENYPRGMFSSVKKGISEVRSAQFFLTPGDYPLITTELCKVLLEYSGQIVKPRYRNKGGHPILLPYECIEEILSESDDSNLKMYLAKKVIKQIDVEDESILFDVDTPEDYEHVKRLNKIKVMKDEYGKY